MVRCLKKGVNVEYNVLLREKKNTERAEQASKLLLHAEAMCWGNQERFLDDTGEQAQMIQEYWQKEE